MTRYAALLATLVVAIGLGTDVANAARSFTVTNNSLLTYVNPMLTFIDSGGRSIACAVTLTASLHPMPAKTRGALMGFINGGKAANCSNTMRTSTTMTLLAEHRRPWHLTFDGFRGTLPRITEVKLQVRNVRILISYGGVFGRTARCLYEGVGRLETRGRTGATEYTLEGLITERVNEWGLFEDGLTEISECADSLELVGTFGATLPPVFRLL